MNHQLDWVAPKSRYASPIHLWLRWQAHEWPSALAFVVRAGSVCVEFALFPSGLICAQDCIVSLSDFFLDLTLRIQSLIISITKQGYWKLVVFSGLQNLPLITVGKSSKSSFTFAANHLRPKPIKNKSGNFECHWKVRPWPAQGDRGHYTYFVLEWTLFRFSEGCSLK